MPLLDSINTLTHATLNAALTTVTGVAPDDFSADLTPEARLLKLINREALSTQYILGLSVLEAIAGSGSMTNNFVTATRILLEFKVYRQQYVSMHGSNNSCLHDALACGEYVEPLTIILIALGADPDQENDKHLTALAQVILDWQEGMGKPYLVSLSAADISPLEKLKIVFQKFIMFADSEEVLTFLRLLNLYSYFKKYPELINIHCNEYQDSLLHRATMLHSAAVIRGLLEQGADPDSLNAFKAKPIHFAYSAIKQNFEAAEIIALLLCYSLRRALPPDVVITAEHIIDELFKFDISNADRKIICSKILEIKREPPFTFTEEILHALLAAKIKALSFDDINVIDKSHGRGVFGEVSLGSKLSSTGTMLVAIKKSIHTNNDSMREEEEILRPLKHRNIIQILGVGDSDGHFMFYMPYARRGTLEKFIFSNDKKILDDCFYSYTRQILEGLDYLHQQGVVHLDFKNGNILLDGDGPVTNDTVIISDFGAAAKIGEHRNSYVTPPLYLCPEGFDLKQPYTAKFDIFSFGMAVGEYDTQRAAWSEKAETNDKVKNVAAWVCAGKRTSFGNKRLSLSVAEFIQGCFKQHPDERPTTKMLLEDVDRYFKPSQR